MRALLCTLLICSSLHLGAFHAAPKEVRRRPMQKLALHDNYNGIVRDLIKNWESPIVYLRQLGYLPSDYEDTSKIKPNLDALISRMERDDEREAVGQDVDKSRQHFCGTRDAKKQKRENALSANEGIKYPSVDQLLAMKQPSLAVAMSAAKVDELLPKLQKPVAQHHAAATSDAQLRLLSQLTQVQTALNANSKSDDFLRQLVAKTSPVATAGAAGMPQVAAVPAAAVGAAAAGDSSALIGRLRRNLRSRLRHRNI